MMRWLMGLAVMMGLLMPPVWASGDARRFDDHHEQGWHFYHERLDAPENKPSAHQQRANQQSRPTAQQTVQAIRQQYREALARALVKPTRGNVKQVIVLQNKISERSHQLADTWQAVLRTHPELNAQMRHPQGHLAKQVHDDQRRQRQQRTIQQLARHTGLFFFYKSPCPYCRKFAPILKHWAEAHHMTVIPIALDGRPLPGWPNYRTDRGQARQFGVRATPAVFVVNPYRHQVVPVAYGLTSESELTARLARLARHWPFAQSKEGR
jgi:conjugal transfer pilus assembly protein TraF